jgi:O-succinylbenzoate synthase
MSSSEIVTSTHYDATRVLNSAQNGVMALPLADMLSSLRVVALPLRTRFRGILTREVALFEGPEGWTEFAPFLEYDDAEAVSWLAAAIDFGWSPTPPTVRTEIRVNATIPAVGPAEVAQVLARYPGSRTAKVKVAEPSQTLQDDIARVRAVRDLLGPEGRIRVDANGGWTVDGAERAIHALTEYDLEYVEQPCATVEELTELRSRIDYLDVPIAADESVRKASDPLAVARAGAADLLVIKAAPLGGICRALEITEAAGLPVVVSSALDSSVGLSMGAYLAASIPALDFDCGLGTAALLATDVTEDPLRPENGAIPVRRVTPAGSLLAETAVSDDRFQWWTERIVRTHALLEAREAN